MRPDDVITDGLLGIVLHHRDVFMCRRMKHDMWTQPCERTPYAPPVADVGDDRHDSEVRVQFRKLHLRLKDPVLAVAEQDYGLWTAVTNLPAKLGTDRSAGACDEDHFPFDITRGIECRGHLRSSQKIGDIDLPKPADADVPIEKLEYAWHGARRDTELSRVLGD